MKDFRGKAIKKGSKIVYPNRQGGSMWMVEAEVLKVEENRIQAKFIGDSDWGRIPSRKRIVYLTALERIAVVG